MKHKEQARNWKITRLGVAILLAFIFSFSMLSAQESMNAAGGNASGSGGSVSYSIGQLIYQTYIGTNGSAAHGVQQPYEISVVSGIEEIGINLNVSIYPNPTTDYLRLEVKDFELSALQFQLYDVQGKLLQSKRITEPQTTISMSSFVPASYFVKVVQGNKEIKTFKIIKT